MQSIIGYMKTNTRQIIAERLDGLMKAHPNLGTQQKLASKTGIGQTTIGRIRRGEVNATSDNLKRIADAFNVPLSFFFGEAVMTTNYDLVLEKTMEAIGKERIADQQTRPDSNVEAGPDFRGKLPLISWVQAGAWAEIVDNFQVGDAEDWILWPANTGPNAFVLRVVGESMYDPNGPKSYAPGDLIAVDPAKEPTNRCMVVVRIDHEDKATFKQLLIDGDTMMLKALNPNWPNRIFPMPAGSRIAGVVIGKYVPE